MTTPLEQQVVSLDLAKRMKEFGAPQESLFWWHDTEHPVDSHKDWYVSDSKEYDTDPAFECVFSAYTVAELGEMLPQVVKKDEKLYYLRCNAGGNSLRYMDYTTYDKNGNGTFLRAYPLVEANTEADARAKMWIYLKENNLI